MDEPPARKPGHSSSLRHASSEIPRPSSKPLIADIRRTASEPDLADTALHDIVHVPQSAHLGPARSVSASIEPEEKPSEDKQPIRSPSGLSRHQKGEEAVPTFEATPYDPRLAGFSLPIAQPKAPIKSAHIAEVYFDIPFGVPRASFGFRDIRQNLHFLDHDFLLVSPNTLSVYLGSRFKRVSRVAFVFTIETGDLNEDLAEADLIRAMEMLVHLEGYEIDLTFRGDWDRKPKKLKKLNDAGWAVFLKTVAVKGWVVISSHDLTNSWGRGMLFQYSTLQRNADPAATAALVLEEMGVLQVGEW